MAGEKEQEVTFIGKCNFRGNERIFGIKTKDRRQHMYVVGKTGTGKTTLLENMVLQDIRGGRGLGIVDPHGEFVERVLEQIPEERMQDVVYFNPVDSEFPIGFNVLEVYDLRYKHLVVSNLLGIFTKIWANVWSARMEYILQNCILALVDTPGTTLLGIPRILVDKEYREKIVANVKDPVVRSFWVHEYETWRDQFRNEAIVPIQNKVGQFLNTGFVRNIVGQPKSTLNIPEIMNSGKILLVNVSKGKIGEENSSLLGAMIITTVQMAAMERVRIPEEERRDFYLYVDEFQNFATDSFASILSEARKYRLNLFIAHQYVGQLVTDVSTKVRDAVFGNVGTMISFRVGAGDAEYLEKEFTPEFLQQDLIGLPNYHIYLKLMVDGVTSRPFSGATLPPLKYEGSNASRDAVIELSRQRYGSAIAEVEKQISRWSGVGGLEQEGENGSSPVTGTASAANVKSGNSTTQMYDAQCSNCGKMTQVPFKPDGKRPVYCLQCLKQIEEGKLIPLPERMPQVGKTRYPGNLGDIGIEFQPQQRAPETRASSPRFDGDRGERPRPAASPPPRYDNDQRERRSSPRAPSSPSDSRMPRRNERRDMPQSLDGQAGERVIPRRPERFPESRPVVPSAGVRSQPIVRVPNDTKKVSLSELRSSESSPLVQERREEKINNAMSVAPAPKNFVRKQEVNVSDLRRTLERFLAENKKPDPLIEDKQAEPENIAAEEGTELKEIAPQKTGNGTVIKPGETITFK